MPDVDDPAESGELPGRFEFAREPSPFVVPADPNFERFSDVIRDFTADPGASYSGQDAAGTPDVLDHFRDTEDPSLSIGYDLQRFLVDGAGDPLDASGDGVLRDDDNTLPNTHLVVERQESAAGLGNDGAGVRTYTVGRGCRPETAEATLDPSSGAPTLMELDYQPRKIRSYELHQPSAETTIDIVSTSDADTIDVVVEDEGATTAETLTLNGTTTVTTTASFADLDAVFLRAAPVGDVTVTDGSGTTLLEIDGGLTYSEDNQPVDGDRGIPALGNGSRASEIGTSYEHFVGDRFQRPDAEAVRTRVNSASWTVENDITTDSVHASRLPVVDVGGRTVEVEADVGGPFVSHRSMRESLTKVQQELVHELDGGVLEFASTVPQDAAERERTADDGGVVSYTETFMASGDPPLVVSAN